MLYPQTAEEADYSHVRNVPFFPYEFGISRMVTCDQGCIFSLSSKQYTFIGETHGSILWTPKTWDAQSGRKVALSDFYQNNPSHIQDIQNWIRLEIAEKSKANPGVYFDNYRELLYNSPHPKGFYLIPDGIIICYRQYNIAPYFSGIPKFLPPSDADASNV